MSSHTFACFYCFFFCLPNVTLLLPKYSILLRGITITNITIIIRYPCKVYMKNCVTKLNAGE